MRYLLLLCGLTFFTVSSAQKTTSTFRVEGVCGMCEQRIEAALDVPGVVAAEWDQDSKLLTVVYKSKQLTEQDLHDALHAVGHDTAAGKATDEQYAGLHGCCKYREGATCTKDD